MTPVPKNYSVLKHSYLRICVPTLVLCIISCAALKTFEIAKDFSKPRYKRIGLLVTRMGNQDNADVSIITLKTNYANRVSKPVDFWTSEVHDVYIEDENRLHESIPKYPDFRSDPVKELQMNGHSKYFGNISPQIYEGISRLLTEKGYEVANVRESSRTWPKSLSEMTIADICTQLKGSVDALFVFHYMDHIDPWPGNSTYSGNGFPNITYSVSMFDLATQLRLLFFKPWITHSTVMVMAEDPGVTGNPATKDRISVEKQQVVDPYHGSYVKYSYTCTLSDTEVVQQAVKYICRGMSWKVNQTQDSTMWKGLDVLIP